MPKVFTRNISVLDPAHESTAFKWRSAKLLLTVFLVGCLLAVLSQAIFLGKNVFNRWDEIRFAYEKPAVVKTVRTSYETKQSKLDQSFANPSSDKSGNQEIIDAIVKGVQESK